MKRRKTTKQIVRGFSKKLRERGIKISKNGQARDKRGKLVSKVGLERRIANIRREETKRPKTKRPSPTKTPTKRPKLTVVSSKRTETKPTKGERRRDLISVSKEWKEERKALRSILGYEPTAKQIERAYDRRMERERKEREYTDLFVDPTSKKLIKRVIGNVTWEEVKAWLVNTSKFELTGLTPAERAERIRQYPIDFYAVMKVLDQRGVLDHATFTKVAAKFGIPQHDVYDVFYGYPPSVGSRAA